MGRKKITVATQVSRLIQDKFLPDSARTGTIKALVQNNDIPDTLVQELLHSIGLTAEHYFNHADHGYYLHGLPTAKIRSLKNIRLALEAALRDAEGQTVELQYLKMGPPNLLHLGWMMLLSDFGYNAETNELTALTATHGTEVYLDDLVVCVPKNQLDDYKEGALRQWGLPPNSGATPDRMGLGSWFGSLRPPTPVYLDPTSPVEYLKLFYCFKRLGPEASGSDVYLAGSVKHDEQIITMPAAAHLEGDFVQAQYKVGGQTKFVFYQVGSGGYPAVDAAVNQPIDIVGKYFPYGYFRYDKVSELDDTSSASYKGTKKLVNKLGLDYDDLAENINANPDIKDVQQAILHFAIPPESDSEVCNRYLFDYFEQLYYAQDVDLQHGLWGPDKPTGAQSPLDNLMTDGWNTMVVDIADNRFTMRLQAKAIYKNLVGGNIGQVGSVKGGKGTTAYATEYLEFWDGNVVTQFKNQPYYYYRKQVTEGLYEEIKVFGLESLYLIYLDRFTTSKENKDIILVPLDHEVCRHYSLLDREKLYSRAATLIFNAVLIQSVAWYETGIFSFILAIVSVVLTIIFPPVGGSMLTTLAAGSVMTLVVLVMAQALINMAVGMMMTVFTMALSELMSGKLLALLAVVLVVASFMSTMNPTSLDRLPSAKDMLAAGSNLSNMVSSAMTNDLQKEMVAYQDYMKDANEALTTLEDSLAPSKYLQPITIFGESPEDFYNRTVHSGNIGTMGFAAVEYFVDAALTLPKIHESLGESIYG